MLKKQIFAILILLNFSIFSQTDPNADPNWDWRTGDDPSVQYPASKYIMYEQTGGTVSAVWRTAPWNQYNAWDGLNDNKKEDGWKLVTRDFGTPTRAIIGGDAITVRPYFALYNIYKSILRVFILAKAQEDYLNGGIKIQFGSETKTATLTNLKPRAYATDKISVVGEYSATSLTDVVGNNVWVWGDFILSFDPTIVPTSSPECPRLTFQIFGTSESNLKIKGTAEGIIGAQKYVRDFLTGTNKGIVTVEEGISATENDTWDFNQIPKNAMATTDKWDNWKKYIDNMYNKIPQYETGGNFKAAINNFKYVIGEIKNNWIVSNLPAIGSVVGFIDAFFGGGKKNETDKTAPSFFGANLSLTGSITTKKNLPCGMTMAIPGSKSNPQVPALGSNVPLIYSNHVGVFNLKKTPVLQYKLYPQANRPPGFPTRQYWDFRVKEDLEIEINNSLGLVLDEITAWIVMDPTNNVNNLSPQNDVDLELLSTWVMSPNPTIELENASANIFSYRSKPINAFTFKYQTIKGPDGKFISPGLYQNGFSPDMTIKIKVVFHRADDPNAIPVVAIQTFEPDFEDAGTGNWPSPPQSVTINIIKNYEFDGTSQEPVQYGFVGEQKQISVQNQITKNGKSYNFAGWSDGNRSNPRTITPQGNETYTALYKIVNSSNDVNAFVNNSQRKIVKTDNGYLHMVYESMGKVWYELSKDDGNSWEIVTFFDGKNPSIDYIFDNVVIAVQTRFGLGNKIFILGYRPNGEKYELVDNLESSILWSDENDNLNPVIGISWGYFQNYPKFILLWEEKYGLYDQPVGIYAREGYIALDYNNTEEKMTDIQWRDNSYEMYIPGTTINSYHPTIAADKNSDAYSNRFHIAWDEKGNNIKYRTAEFSYPNGFILSTVQDISNGSGFTKNYNPTIIELNGGARVSWIGYRDGLQEAYSTPNKVNSNDEIQALLNPEWKTIFRDPSVSRFWQFGNNVNSPSINKVNNNSAYFLAWSESNGQYNKFTDSYTLSRIKTLNTAGKDLQLSNGLNRDYMRASSFNSNSLPYYFSTSNSIGSYYQQQKTDGLATISAGREGVVVKGDAQFFFAIGDIRVNDEVIDFIEIEDTVSIDNLDKLNKYLVSKPFTINGNTTFNYGVQYGFTDSANAMNSFSDNEYINFKVELINKNSNEVVGSFDDVKFDKGNVFQYANISYNVNTEGINGNKEVYLRLKVVPNFQEDGKYSLSQKYADEYVLLKSGSKEITYQGNLAVTSYDLSQNYPNPFNPSTTINYQIPKSGFVSLKVYDILGREVAVLVNGEKEMGRYTVQFDGSKLASGVYIYELRANEFVSVKKLMLLK